MMYLQDAKFPPKRKRKRYLPDILILLESQIFGKLPKISILLFFFFSTIWCCTSMLVHAHDRKIPCSFFLLLSLGSIPVFRFERSIATFIKARNRENFCHPLVVIFYPVREIERNAMHNSKFFIGIIHADRMI